MAKYYDVLQKYRRVVAALAGATTALLESLGP